jgi:hypothetical protein
MFVDVLGLLPQNQEVVIKTENFALKLYELDNFYDNEYCSQYLSTFTQAHYEEVFNFIFMWFDKLDRGYCKEDDWIDDGSIISKLLASRQDKDIIMCSADCAYSTPRPHLTQCVQPKFYCRFLHPQCR